MKKALPAAVALVLAAGFVFAQAKAPSGVDSSSALTATAYTASSSSQFNCSKTDATCILTSSTADATTSATVGAITLKSGANIATADLVLDVQDSAAAHIFGVTEEGSLKIPATQAISIGSYFFSNNGANGRFFLGSASLTGDGTLWLGSVVVTGTGTGLDLTSGGVISAQAKTRGTCTLNGASPSTCTATVVASMYCTCSIVGATAAIAAKGCAVGLSGTTLTITSANAATEAVNYICIL